MMSTHAQVGRDSSLVFAGDSGRGSGALAAECVVAVVGVVAVTCVVTVAVWVTRRLARVVTVVVSICDTGGVVTVRVLVTVVGSAGTVAVVVVVVLLCAALASCVSAVVVGGVARPVFVAAVEAGGVVSRARVARVGTVGSAPGSRRWAAPSPWRLPPGRSGSCRAGGAATTGENHARTDLPRATDALIVGLKLSPAWGVDPTPSSRRRCGPAAAGCRCRRTSPVHTEPSLAISVSA
jgi:hypothetical protein